MLVIRRNAEIPLLEGDWYRLRPHFAFHGVTTKTVDRFGALTLLNDDVIAPERATNAHVHAGVEILTYVIAGRFRHNDTLGNTFELDAGEVELFSFGSGAGHMERNNGSADDLRMILMYVAPREPGGVPLVHRAKLERTASGVEQPLIEVAVDEFGGEHGVMPLRQRARIAFGLPGGFRDVVHLEPGHGAYVYAIAGDVTVGDAVLGDGDAAMICEAFDFGIEGSASAHAIVAVVPMSISVSVPLADVASIVGNVH